MWIKILKLLQDIVNGIRYETVENLSNLDCLSAFDWNFCNYE